MCYWNAREIRENLEQHLRTYFHVSASNVNSLKYAINT